MSELAHKTVEEAARVIEEYRDSIIDSHTITVNGKRDMSSLDELAKPHVQQLNRLARRLRRLLRKGVICCG